MKKASKTAKKELSLKKDLKKEARLKYTAGSYRGQLQAGLFKGLAVVLLLKLYQRKIS